MAILELRNVTKRFGGLTAVDDVSLDLHEGEILGLIGPNGAGKTTLVNVITGADSLTGGEIVFMGRRVGRLPAYRRGRMGLARTFQVVKPFRNLTVRENVAVGAMFGSGGARRTSAEAFRRADELLEFVGFSERGDYRADEITLGDQKRLELAKALAMDPKLLMLDEVMAGLNARETQEAMQLIQKVSQSGVTLLVIEHIMKAVMGVSSRIVVLNLGRVLAEGTPEEIVGNEKVIGAYLGQRWATKTASNGGKAVPE